MSAQLKEQPPLFNVDRREGLRGAWVRHTTAGPRPDWPLAPDPGNAVRIYRADRAKPLAAKLAHGSKPSRVTGEPSGHSVAQKAKAMAEHIRRIGQTEVPLWYLGREAWPAGVPSSARQFSEALLHELRGYSYTVVYVDPSKDVLVDNSVD